MIFTSFSVMHCLPTAQQGMHLFHHHLSLSLLSPLPSIPASPFLPPSYHQTMSVPHPPAAHLSHSHYPPSPDCLVFSYRVESEVSHIMHVPAVQHIPSAPALMRCQRWISSI